jgi:hypothetical protein
MGGLCLSYDARGDRKESSKDWGTPFPGRRYEYTWPVFTNALPCLFLKKGLLTFEVESFIISHTGRSSGGQTRDEREFALFKSELKLG